MMNPALPLNQQVIGQYYNQYVQRILAALFSPSRGLHILIEGAYCLQEAPSLYPNDFGSVLAGIGCLCNSRFMQ